MDIIEKLRVLEKQLYTRGTWDSQLDVVQEAICTIIKLQQECEKKHENVLL